MRTKNTSLHRLRRITLHVILRRSPTHGRRENIRRESNQKTITTKIHSLKKGTIRKHLFRSPRITCVTFEWLKLHVFHANSEAQRQLLIHLSRRSHERSSSCGFKLQRQRDKTDSGN